MKNWLKFTLALGLASLSTIACAQDTAPQPAVTPVPPTPPAERAAAQRDAEVRARSHAEQAQSDARRAEADAHGVVARTINVGFGSGKKEKVAFIGIVSTRVTGALRENLSLPRGVGLVVETVEKESPAGKAGLQQYDILQKLDDQLLVFPEQLGVLVRLHKPGEEVTLSVLRKGQPQTLKVTLGEKEMHVNADGLQSGMFQSGMFTAATPEAPIAWAQLEREGLGDKLKLLRTTSSNSSANYIFQDGQTTLEITRKDDSKHLKATDKDGKVLFDGGIDTDEQRKAIPEDVAKKLAKLEERMKSLPETDEGEVKLRVLEP